MKNSNIIKTAVILGAGERKCFDKPVGFLNIENTTVIERLITLLNANGIEKIIVVTGYKKEFYERLAEKKNLILVYNDKYKWTGTMYSLSLIKPYVDEDFLLIESDMVFEERAISHLVQNKNKDCMVITSESGSGDEAFVETSGENIFRISKDIHQLNKVDGEFIGLSKFSKETFDKMMKNFKLNKNPFFFYEYAAINISNKPNIGFVKIDDLVWSELDNMKQYNNLKYVIYPKLKRKEMEIKKVTVKKIISDVLKIDPEKVSEVEKLGGLTNKNYKVKIDNDYYAARIPGNGTRKFINRSNEKSNSHMAYEIGLDSRAIYFDEFSGLKICEFIKDAETLNIATTKREDNMKLMADALKKLHDSGKLFKNDFDPFDGSEFYEKSIIDSNAKLFDGYYEVKKVYMTLKNKLNELGIKKTACHLDPLAENFVKSGSSKIYLIDWEYSGNYDPLWDVAAVSLESEFSEDEEELFFNKYFKRKITQRESSIIKIHKIMQDIFWSLWAAAKVAKGDDYLTEYASYRYERAKKNIKKYAFDKTLENKQNA